MKSLLSAFVALLLAHPIAIAQNTAPDFTITTTDTVQRSLYADYLNEGKTVLIKFFFTTCPPCNAMAPLMEPFYQDWGGGQGDVEFLSLSIQNFDDNADVATYKDQYGQTFPGAGSDGGSTDAVAPYLAGDFGPFFGTPTFAVIAPDGEVSLIGGGGNPQAVIDAVDQALAGAGAVTPQEYALSGAVQTPSGVGIPNVAVTLAGFAGLSYSDTTDAAGQFAWTARLMPNRDYYAMATKHEGGPDGVTTLDLIRIQKQILGITELDPTERLAADANRSGHVSTADLIQLRRLILFSNYELPDGPPWIFYEAGFPFPTDNPFPPFTNGEANLRINMSEGGPLTVEGRKTGDVNDSAEPGN